MIDNGKNISEKLIIMILWRCGNERKEKIDFGCV